MDYSYFYCNCRWTDGRPSDTPKTEEEALARIDKFYTSGVPFFTKEIIRSAWKQMQQPLADGDKIYLKALDGAMIEYDMRIGCIEKTTPEPDGPDTERVLEAPFVKYESRAGMRQYIFQHGYEENSPLLCPISIYHICRVRLKDSHKPAGKPRPPQEKIARDFERYRALWHQTEMCARITRILDSAAAGLDIRKVIALSLGSLGHDYGENNDRAGRQDYQHAMAISLRDWVRKRNADVLCYAQDPEYVDGDKAILRKHQVQVIDDPVAWLEMDDFSLVISISSDVPSKEITADLCRPAVVVWNQVGNEDYDQRGGDRLTDPCSPRVRAMMEGYDCYDFGASFEHFGDVFIYVRRPKTLCRENLYCSGGSMGG